MESKILHIKKDTPQPVWFPTPIGIRDPRQDMPACWCILCGAGVYRPDRNICSDCLEEMENEENLC